MRIIRAVLDKGEARKDDPDTSTDFSTAQGDRIDIRNVLDMNFHAGIDNISDFVHFTPSGANAVMSVDVDGAGTAHSFVNVATLTGDAGLDATTLYANGNLLVA